MSIADESWSTILPTGYDEDDAARDRRDLATLESPGVNWRVKRRLRQRVGEEVELATRLEAWAMRVPAAPAAPAVVLRTAASDAEHLALEYRRVCAHVWGVDDPDVLANAERIARGEVLPWEARHVISEERARAQEFRQRSAELQAVVAIRDDVDA